MRPTEHEIFEDIVEQALPLEKRKTYTDLNYYSTINYAASLHLILLSI